MVRSQLTAYTFADVVDGVTEIVAAHPNGIYTALEDMDANGTIGGPVVNMHHYVTNWSGSASDFNGYWTTAVAAAEGGVLVVPEGAYKMLCGAANINIPVPNNTRISGQPGAVITVTGDNFSNADITTAGYSASTWPGTGFSMRATNDATYKENIIIEGLEFVGGNSPYVYSGGTAYQGMCIRLWSVGTNLTRNIRIRNNRFRNLYGFPIQAAVQHDTGAGLPGGRMFSYVGNEHIECGNGANLNWPYSINAFNFFYRSEGFENAGQHNLIFGNIFREVYGAISLGGDTTAGRELPGGIVSHNIIDIDHAASAIILSDGAVGAQIVHNTIRKCRTIAINTTSSTGVAPRDCLIESNVLISCGRIIAAWTAANVIAVGDYRRPTAGTTGKAFKATVAGTTHAATEPTWPATDGSTVTDGTVTWIAEGGYNTISRFGTSLLGDGFQVKNNKIYQEADDTAEWQLTHGLVFYGDNDYLDGNSVEDSVNFDIVVNAALNTKLGDNQYSTISIVATSSFASGTILTGSETKDWADLATATQQTENVTVTGAALGDHVVGVSMSVDLAGTSLRGYVSAADTVTVYHRNDTGGNVNLASGTLRAVVRKA